MKAHVKEILVDLVALEDEMLTMSHELRAPLLGLVLRAKGALVDDRMRHTREGKIDPFTLDMCSPLLKKESEW
jgi:hypothetical protein